MNIPVKSELREICKEISALDKTEAEWAEIESDDMFQLGPFIGGFDEIEMAFCFSVYLDGDEYWFQITLAEVQEIAAGNKTQIDVRVAG